MEDVCMLLEMSNTFSNLCYMLELLQVIISCRLGKSWLRRKANMSFSWFNICRPVTDQLFSEEYLTGGMHFVTYYLKKILFVKLHALANATKSPNWWKGLRNPHIHFNTLVHDSKSKAENFALLSTVYSKIHQVITSFCLN